MIRAHPAFPHLAVRNRLPVLVAEDHRAQLEEAIGRVAYLFGRAELEEGLAGWRILSSVHESFPAPGDTRKDFSIVIAQKVEVDRSR